MRRASVILLALLASSVGAQTAPNDRRFVEGKRAWLGRQYPKSTSLLFDFRSRQQLRSAQLDYMIGTGGCRTPGRRSWGMSYLAWALYRYSLSPASRALVLRERELCRSGATLPVLTSTVATAALQTTAGSWAQGKMYYLRDADEPVATYSARTLGTLDPAAVAKRLVQIGDAAGIAAALAPVAPAGARIHVVSRYAFVTKAGQSDDQMAAIAARLDAYLAFLDRTYGIRLPPYYLALYLVPDQADLRAVARDLHKLDVSPATIGYTFRDDQSAVALIPGTAIGTLFHELFHLVVRSTFGDIPQWLDEGIAALYEVSEINGGNVQGVRNWRGPVLLDLWSRRPPLRDVIAADWYVSDTPSEQFNSAGAPPSSKEVAAQFAVARYFALYLQDKGKLGAVFARVKALEPDESVTPAAAALGAVTAEMGPLDALQTDFDRWFLETERGAAVPAAAGATRIEKYEPGHSNARAATGPCSPASEQQQQQQQQQTVPCR